MAFSADIFPAADSDDFPLNDELDDDDADGANEKKTVTMWASTRVSIDEDDACTNASTTCC